MNIAMGAQLAVLVLALLLVLGGCSRDDNHTGIGMFNQPAKPSLATLDEAKRLDDVQHLYRDGLFDRARVALDLLLADGSRQPQAYFLKAQLTRQAGDFAATIPWCGKAIEASPSWIEPRILLAQMYLKLERHSAAANVFADIERLAPRGPWGLYGQATVAAMRGDHASAAVFADQALERDPDHGPSIQLRAQLAKLSGDPATEERMLVRLTVLDPLDPSVRVRLGELAQSGGRLEDAKRQLVRAYELEARPSTAAKLADLARLTNDPDGERYWNARREAGPSPVDQDAPPAPEAENPPVVQ